MVASFPGPRLWNVDIEVVQVWRAWYFCQVKVPKVERGAIDTEEVEYTKHHR